MRPDYLVLLIALNPLGAGIPGRDPTLGIQQENRIIDYALDQDSEQLVAARRQEMAWAVFSHWV